MDVLVKEFKETSIFWFLLSAIIGGIIGAWVKLIFEIVIPAKILQKRDIIITKRKYSTPILLSCDTLRKRCENMITYIKKIEEEKWLDPEKRNIGYYYPSTLFSILQFIGWHQILRREIIYLDFTSTKETRTFDRFIRKIIDTLSNPSLLTDSKKSAPELSDDKWVYFFTLTALGDAMVIKDGNDLRTLSYHEFLEKIFETNDKKISRWLDSLGDIFINIKETDIRFKRIVVLHTYLKHFIEYLDPKHVRTEFQKSHLNILGIEENKRISDSIKSIRRGWKES